MEGEGAKRHRKDSIAGGGCRTKKRQKRKGKEGRRVRPPGVLDGLSRANLEIKDGK